jgi:hypothetical protein
MFREAIAGQKLNLKQPVGCAGMLTEDIGDSSAIRNMTGKRQLEMVAADRKGKPLKLQN